MGSYRIFNSSHMLAILWMLLACFLLSMIAAIGRYAAFEGMHPFQTVFLRLGAALLCLLPFVLHAGIHTLRTSRFKLHLFRAANGICAMWLWFSAIAYIPIDEQTALSFLAPIFTTIGAVVILGEVVRLRRISAILISLVGALIIIRPGFAEFSIGHGFAMSSALAMGVTMLLIKTLTAKDSALTIVFYSNLLMLVPASVPAMMVWSWPEPALWWWITGFGPSAAIGHFALAKAYSYADASFVASIDYARLPCAALIGWILFSELSDIWTWIGASIIFASTLYIAQRELKLAKLKENQS